MTRRTTAWIILGVLVASYVTYGLIAKMIGDRMSPHTNPTGNWVGVMEITGGYDPRDYGDTPGPHKQDVAFARLDLESSHNNEYWGKGELTIIGERKPRPMNLGVKLNGGGDGSLPFEGFISTQPELAGNMQHVTFRPEQIVVRSDMIGDLHFTLTFHRGDHTEYDRLIAQMSASTSRAAAA